MQRINIVLLQCTVHVQTVHARSQYIPREAEPPTMPPKKNEPPPPQPEDPNPFGVFVTITIPSGSLVLVSGAQGMGMAHCLLLACPRACMCMHTHMHVSLRLASCHLREGCTCNASKQESNAHRTLRTLLRRSLPRGRRARGRPRRTSRCTFPAALRPGPRRPQRPARAAATPMPWPSPCGGRPAQRALPC